MSLLSVLLIGLAVNLDSFAAGLHGLLPSYTPLLMGLLQMTLLAGGILAAAHLLPENATRRFPYLPGAILILLGIIRLR